MPVRDRYHENVKNALIKDGWTITDDPFHLKWGKRDMYVDLGAEKLIAAQKEGQYIAVEIKTFRSVSDMTDLEHALGQYLAYRSVMTRTNPERVLYLAVRDEVYADIFDEPIAKLLIEDYKVHIVVFQLEQEVIFRWIPWSSTGN
ncbi:element excision factor XisH family protein [Nostoc sp.]|uniref:element excision factor XisH family protein n=1 Tax=Nostoc sp. TaxID=1180 RepID=UPI002FF491D8